MKQHSAPPPTMVSLKQRLQNACNALDIAEPRARRQLAVIFVGQMLGRLGGVAAIKGATNIEARLGVQGTRVSRDLDTTVAMEADRFTAELRSLLDAGWAGFTGTLSSPQEIRAPVPAAYRPTRFTVKVRSGTRGSGTRGSGTRRCTGYEDEGEDVHVDGAAGEAWASRAAAPAIWPLGI